MIWQWYEWDSVDAFNVWHDSIKTTLGFPKPPVNQASGEIDESAQWSVEYTEPIQVGGKIVAVVQDEYADGLTSTDLRPPRREYGLES